MYIKSESALFTALDPILAVIKALTYDLNLVMMSITYLMLGCLSPQQSPEYSLDLETVGMGEEVDTAGHHRGHGHLAREDNRINGRLYVKVENTSFSRMEMSIVVLG